MATRTPSTSPSTPAAPDAPRRAYVLGGNRIPFARAGGKYAQASNQDMLTAALDGLVARYGLQGETIGEVAAGAVLKHSRDFNLTREAVLGSALAATTPAYDVQQACATGLETVVSLSNKIRLGQLESAIAGGVDTTSDAPIAVSDRLRRILLDLSHARTPQQRLKAIARLRPKDLAPATPRTSEPRTHLSMGEHQALTTAQWGITREAQDEVALRSHQRLAAAYDAGFFDDLVTPYRGLTRDANLRADTSLEKLAKLKPTFGLGLDTEATMTAGNSTPLTDGASTVLLGSAEWAAAHDLTPLAAVVDAEAAAVDFVHGVDGLLMAPAFAVPRLLARHGLTLDDLDYVEIHEAFASTVLTTLAAWESEEFGRERLGLDGAFGTVDPARLNVHGSSLAAGHPFAATGGRIIATIAKELHARRSAQVAAGSDAPVRALVSICAAGGLGLTALLEAA
ncbi:acetyl-CoA acetyltransferase [Cellulomonas flavigena DSM 20109]|uniref:Acetyl-CoA acetyltransferase n=1 Tax=Cellulomonas flavigena (strain ATCC 482 / DSM 20109 / BCRC 11376 / JCM 18109 / NBRC 3775 / NCIMB 8073 / NRS 134) TaxID=446466 RepID=D5UKF9_CELFN|nr:acetyl-CoA C-acetyltransferase [Cellulomonas flavigena]ADG75820.1 acetyl-CoA acetyltransferase [Cellulomonas flavigena DSM 20109]